eukprot:660603-Lingulodinium_polyedra.AAC.1
MARLRGVRQRLQGGPGACRVLFSAAHPAPLFPEGRCSACGSLCLTVARELLRSPPEAPAS